MCCPGPRTLEPQDHCCERGRVAAFENLPSRCLFPWVTVFKAHAEDSHSGPSNLAICIPCEGTQPFLYNIMVWW